MLDNDTMVLNILAAYADATTDERRDGFAWYPEALDFAQGLTDAYGIRVEQSAAVIAALSPQLDWERNKVWAAEVVDAWHSGTILPRRGLGNSLRRAAIALRGDLTDIEREKGSLKVHRFYHSILGHSGYATVDRHALRVALGNYGDAVPAMTDNAYRSVERAYIDASGELRKGTRHIQAVTWIVCRRERGLIDDPNKFAREHAKRRHPSYRGN